MQTSTVLVAIVFAVTSFPFRGQAVPPDGQPGSPAAQQTTPGAMQQQQPNSPTAAQPGQAVPEQPGSAATAPATSAPAATAALDMHPVHTELMSNLDSKTAKAGDDVVVQTKSSVKTSDGTEIPKGSKLMGHVVGVQPSGGGKNAQVALQFDRAELKGGQTMAIHSEIQSIGSSDASAGAPSDMGGGAMSPGGAGAGASPSTSGAQPGSSAQGANQAQPSPGYAQGAPGMGSNGNSGATAAGKVVAKTGNIEIRTTSVPGVLLAKNEPGQQDPRLANASGILLSPQNDVQLKGGTEMVLNVAATGAPSK